MSYEKIKAVVIPVVWGGVTLLVFDHVSYKFRYEDSHQFLSDTDLTLLAFCPLASALGLSVSSSIKKLRGNTAEKPPLLVALVLGLLVALYFTGAIEGGVSSVTRVIGLCILLGYQAPNLWNLQEHVVKREVDKRISELGLAKNEKDS